jgi:hypothetical protein
MTVLFASITGHTHEIINEMLEINKLCNYRELFEAKEKFNENSRTSPSAILLIRC